MEAMPDIISELDLESLLQRVLAIACELTGAAYAALGVLDEDRQRARAVHHARHRRRDPRRRSATSPAAAASSGVLIEHPEPLRLGRRRQPPELIRLPAGHPPMTTFLGVPIADPRRGVGEPVPDREGRRRVHGGGRGGDRPARRLGRRSRSRTRGLYRERERAPRRARAGRARAAGDDGHRQRRRRRDRARARARADRQARAGARATRGR